MPTYEYECLQCRRNFEVFQGIKEEPLKKCPECGGKVKRLIGAGAAVIFRGSGFYETDYKRKKTESSSDRPKPSASEKPKTEEKTKTDEKGKG